MRLLETLNKVEGRPDWLREWESKVVYGETVFGCASADGGRFHVCANEQGGVFIGDVPALQADHALELALYAKRVNIALERLNAPRMYMAGEEGDVQDSLDDAISEAFSKLDRPKDGDVIELELYEAVKTPMEKAVGFDNILSTTYELYYGDCDDWADGEQVSAKDGARLAFETWAEAYLTPSTPVYECGERIVRHIVVRGGGNDCEVIEDKVAEALAFDKTPRTIGVAGVSVAINADGGWEVVKP